MIADILAVGAVIAQAPSGGGDSISSWLHLAGQIGGLIVVVLLFLRHQTDINAANLKHQEEANSRCIKDMEALITRIESSEQANRESVAQLGEEVKAITQGFRDEHHQTVAHLLQTTREVVQTLGAVTAQLAALGLQVAALRDWVEGFRQGGKKPGGGA